jgi:hypothetical protein
MSIINGNGSATGRPRQSARSLRHQRLDKRQLAAKLACILEGDVELVPSARQLAQWFGVNETYIRTVRAMSPEKRHAIASGKDSTSSINPCAELAIGAAESGQRHPTCQHHPQCRTRTHSRGRV